MFLSIRQNTWFTFFFWRCKFLWYHNSISAWFWCFILNLETLDFSIADFGVVFLGHTGRCPSLINSHYFPFNKLAARSENIYLSITVYHFGTDFVHVQIFGQNPSHSFSIYVQLLHLLNNQQIILSHHFNNFFHIWFSSKVVKWTVPSSSVTLSLPSPKCLTHTKICVLFSVSCP